MSSDSLKQLSQLSTYISTSEKEIGYTVDFSKPYIEIRSNYLLKSLHTLSQSVQVSERHQGISYEKGSGEFLKYMECFTKAIQVLLYKNGRWKTKLTFHLVRADVRIKDSQ